MSRTFFNALGRSFMRKHASRLPWPTLVQALRQKELLPDIVPRLPFLESEPEVIPVPVEVPVPVEEDEEEPAPEPRPKSKPENGMASPVEPTDR
jgi:hypothetical protein